MDTTSISALAALVWASQPLAVPVVKRATSLLGSLLGPAAKALGARLGAYLTPPEPVAPTVLDTIVLWRHRNMTVVLARAADCLDARGVKPREIPAAALLPLLEAASMIEDPDLQEMWAQLLASGVEADEHQHPMWVRVLSQVSGKDARRLRAIGQRMRELGRPFARPGDRVWIPGDVPSAEDARMLALGLVAVCGVQRMHAAPRVVEPVVLPDTVEVQLSEVGAQFVDAVMPGVLPPQPPPG